ncbi:DEAD/DEAH box helicase [bacterium]|nr:DEAD/DEAH box helicase [bacterium]
MDSFKETGLNDEILKAIGELGFEKPTPIQAQTIPHLLESDQDVIAFAQTGTGKTAAFGLPSVQKTDVEERTTQTLILSPTRELCLQITRDLTKYAKYVRGLAVVPVYGGAPIDVQIKALRRGAHIVVATPGRAKDLIQRGRLLLGDVRRLVLDEADEMLTMGFKEELDTILAETPEEKQTLLFSATMSRDIRNITKRYMHDPLELATAQKNMAAENVTHEYYMVSARDKYEVVKRIADVNPTIYGIVFCRTRRETKEIANKLMTDGYNADALHGDLSQAQRDEVMGQFRKRQLQILVATDVAARGLDVTDLTHIINMTLPDDPEIYIHRSGRTGRAGKSGTSIAIIHTREVRKIQDIERKFKMKFNRASVPTGKEICTNQLYSLIDKMEKVEVDESQIGPFLPEIYAKLEWLSREELIKHFVSTEFNRFLAYYKNARDINIAARPSRERGRDDRGRNSRDSRDSRDSRGSRDSRDGGVTFARIHVNVGSKQKLTPVRLIGMINEALDSSSAKIGKIEIMQTVSFVEIDEAVAQNLIEMLSGWKMAGIPLKLELARQQDRPSRSFTRGERPPRRGSFSGSSRSNRSGSRSDKKSRD